MRIKNVSSAGCFAKNRTLAAIQIDRQSALTEILQEPLQPYMEFMMNVAAEAILKRGINDTININNKNTGLRYQIHKIEKSSEDDSTDRYNISLYNGNEIRFNGIVLNGGLQNQNQWYFTQKYEDVVSKNDIAQFIQATAILYGKMQTDRDCDLETLVQWVALKQDPSKERFDFDKTSYIIFQPDGDGYQANFYMQNINLCSVMVYACFENIPIVENATVYHDVSQNVLNGLADMVRKDAYQRIVDIKREEVEAAQKHFFNTHAGIHYNEQATLNDLFKQYV